MRDGYGKSSGRIGVGIVGLSASGGWALRAHVPALQAIPRYEIRGLTASSLSSAAAAAQKFGVPWFSDDPRALAARDDIDLIVISVKVPEHFRLLDAVMVPGKVVYCEWPLGNGLEEAAQITAEAHRRGVRAFTGLQARSAPPVRYLHDLIADGYVGKVLSSTLVASGRSWGGQTQPGGEYLLDVRNGANMLTIPAGHTLDAVCMVLGDLDEISASTAVRRPVAKMAGSDVTLPMTAADQVCVTGVVGDGAVFNMHFRGGMSRGVNFLWEINGTEGDISITGENGHLQFGHVTLRGGRGEERQLQDLPVPEKYRRLDLDPTGMGYCVGHAYLGLLDALEGRESSVPTFADALRSHERLRMIETAAATGQRQKIAVV